MNCINSLTPIAWEGWLRPRQRYFALYNNNDNNNSKNDDNNSAYM